MSHSLHFLSLKVTGLESVFNRHRPHTQPKTRPISFSKLVTKYRDSLLCVVSCEKGEYFAKLKTKHFLWHYILQRKTTNSNTTRSFARMDNLECDRSFWVMMTTNCQHRYRNCYGADLNCGRCRNGGKLACFRGAQLESCVWIFNVALSVQFSSQLPLATLE